MYFCVFSSLGGLAVSQLPQLWCELNGASQANTETSQPQTHSRCLKQHSVYWGQNRSTLHWLCEWSCNRFIVAQVSLNAPLKVFTHIIFAIFVLYHVYTRSKVWTLRRASHETLTHVSFTNSCYSEEPTGTWWIKLLLLGKLCFCFYLFDCENVHNKSFKNMHSVGYVL